MSRVKVCWTIDEDLVNWIVNHHEGFDSVSDYASKILRDKMNSNRELSEEFVLLDQQERSIEEKRGFLYKEAKKRIEEGNKKERAEAEEYLKAQEKKKQMREEQKKEFINKFTSAIQRYRLEDDFNSCKTYSDVINLLAKIVNMNSEKDRSAEFTGAFQWASVIFNELIKPKEQEVEA